MSKTTLPAENPLGHILFVDDDADVLKAASLLLTRHGFRVTPAHSPAEAWSVMAAEPVDVVLLDLNFRRGQTDGAEGFACLAGIMAQDPDAVVVVVTGHSGVNIAVAAMRAGASDFVMKPWRNAALAATLESALALRRWRRRPGAAIAPEGLGEPILGESPAIARARDLIGRAAPTDAAVLIFGEAGTGKSLMARALHRQSARARGPLVAVDLETQTDLAGAASAACGGTLFLDEVGALPPAAQARLLAALDAARDIRVVAATRGRRDTLHGREGLRDDLLYRLNTVEVFAPPLRERGGDALILAEHFLRLFAQRHGRPVKPLAPEAAEAIIAHDWPGDVRALRQAMERCVIFTEGARHELEDIPFAHAAAETAPTSPPMEGPPARTLAKTERALVAQALKRNGFNVSQAARELGLTRAALYRRMAKHGL